MKLNHWGIGCIAGLTAALVGGPAGATTIGLGSITDLRFELFSLDPTGGSTPSLVWDGAYAITQATRDHGQFITLYPQPDGSLQWGVSYANSDSDLQDNGTQMLPALTASVAGVTASTGSNGLTASAQATPGNSLSAFAYAFGSFLLSPLTELRLTATLQTLADGPGSSGFNNPPGVTPDIGVAFSQATGFAEVNLGVDDRFFYSSGVSYTPNTNPAVFPIDPYSFPDGSQVTLSLVNDGSEGLARFFFAQVGASASELLSPPREDPAPVPAPGPLGLLAIGGLALYRRRAR